MKNNEREKKITKVSIVGITTNFFLVILKAIIGLLSNSIAIVLDALNNLSDAVSSVVTIIGLVLAGKKPDRKHPYGYGRIEYFSSLIVSFIVIAAGISAFRESFSKIITPEETNFSVLTFIIMLIAVITKILLGLYTKNKGKELNSGSLIASGSDALFDSIITLSTIIGAIINVIFKFNIDGYLGIIISLIIIIMYLSVGIKFNLLDIHSEEHEIGNILLYETGETFILDGLGYLRADFKYVN